MATALGKLRSGLQSAVRGGNHSEILKRSFASSASHDDEQETVKWQRVTFAGIITCTILAIYNLSKGHHHFEEPPPYPYLHIRNKEFPWVLRDIDGQRWKRPC